MNFSDYKKLMESSLKDSIDDSDVLHTLTKYSIYNDRIKLDNGDLLYKFDNRYSLQYDGEVFTLYRRGDRIHYENARNLTEIDAAISKWLSTYSLDSIEINDKDNDDVDALIAKISGETPPDDTDKKSDDNQDQSGKEPEQDDTKEQK